MGQIGPRQAPVNDAAMSQRLPNAALRCHEAATAACRKTGDSMLLKRFFRPKRSCFAVALPAVLIVALGSAWGQGQPQAPRPRPRDTKSAETRAATPPKPTDDAAVDTAQAPESPPKPNDASRSPSDPLVALVEGHMIYLSDLARLVPSLPESVRSLPFETLYPALLDRSIDHQALVAVARRE